MSMKLIEIANKILEIMDEQYPSEIQGKGVINTLYTIIRSIKETETIPSNVHLKDHARMLIDATNNYNLEIIYLLQDLDKELKRMNVKDSLQHFSSNRTEKNREQLLSNLEKSSFFVPVRWIDD